MKILQMLPSLEVGGVERGVVDMARAMQNGPDQVVVVSSGGSLVKELEKIAVRHYTLPVNRKSLMTLRLVPRIVEIIRQENIQVVHARSRVPAWIGWFAARQAGVPFVTTCHGYYSRHALSRVMGWGRRVIVISRIIGRHMIDDFKVPPERIRLIHRGIDLSDFPWQPRQTGRNFFRIINVGRLSPIKGQYEFLQAVHLLRRKIQKLEVWLVGSEGKGKTKYTRRLEELIRQLGLESCVRMLGTRRDISELIADSDLLVLSTLVPEAFGRVLVEAGAVGTPVISTRVGGVLDVLEEGVHGRLVEPGNAEEMAAAMLEAAADPESSRRMAENLRHRIEKEFTVEKMVEETRQVYREVACRKKILIFKLGAMGDLILGTPSFRMLRRRFPDASISLVVDKTLVPLISGCPYINEIIPVHRKKLPRPSYFLKLATRLRRDGYDISVDFQNNKWTHLLAVMAGIPDRYGFRRGRLGFLVNHHDKNFSVAEAPVKHQFRILSRLGVSELDEKLELWPNEESEKQVAELFSQHEAGGEGPWIGFVPDASPNWATKRWPGENFMELARHLVRKHPACRIVLLGREDMAGLPEWNLNGSVLNLTGKTSLSELVAVIRRLDVLVTGDTAPLHIAAAVQTPFVTLFGPTDPDRHVPPGEGRVLVARGVACRPCYQGECREKDHLACLKKISVDEVYRSIRSYIKT